MAVRYLPIDGEVVSAEWHVVLVDMRADGVAFNVNEGKRTMARQWYFYNGYRRGLPGFNLAAFPSPLAPHIRVGRIDHAIDFGNDAAVFSWLRAHGLRPARTVAGESWHIECPASSLRAYAATHGFAAREAGILEPLGRRQRRAARTLLHRRRVRAAEAQTGEGPRWRNADRLVARSRSRIERLYRRASGERKQLLRLVLIDRDGRV